MGRTHSRLTPDLVEFIERQHLFFVATAPLSETGHVNLSPKGLDTFRVIDDRTVAYLDLTGSGIETAAHLQENGRIAVLFCSFDGAPRLVRLHGRGRVVERAHADYDALSARFPAQPGVRGVIVIDVQRISGSCGFGVPLYEYQGDRRQLTDWASRKGPDGIADYAARHNESVDGLPGLETPEDAGRE